MNETNVLSNMLQHHVGLFHRSLSVFKFEGYNNYGADFCEFLPGMPAPLVLAPKGKFSKAARNSIY